MRIPLKSRIARRLLSLLPSVGLLPRPARPQGISAILRICNEKDWLEASIESVKDDVDEIIAVDNGSTDGSREILEKLAIKLKKLRVFSFAGKAPWDYSNFAIEKSSYRWIMKWDADFVGFNREGSGLRGLVEYVRALDQRMYYYLNPLLIELTGDFYHQFSDLRVRGDMEIFTYSENARYVPVARTFSRSPYPVKLPPGYTPPIFSLRLEGIKLPVYYRILPFDASVAYHVNIKPAIRHLTGYFYVQWLASDGFAKGVSLEDYVLEQIREKWGFADLDSAAAFYMAEYSKWLVPYDKNLGELPKNIIKLAEGSPFTVTYKEGKPAGRVG